MVSRINTTYYSLNATMYPSYTYALFKLDNGWWIKQYGFKKTGRMKLTNGFLEYTGFTVKEVMDLSGLWYDPIAFLNDLDPKIRGIIEEIVSIYHHVRISISPYDHNLIFILAFLSRRTDFHVNVVKWALKLFNAIHDINDVFKINLNSVGSSFQLKQLKEAVKSYLKVTEGKIKDPWSLRMKLLEIKYVGPKVTDAFILFHTYYSWIAPSDIHYQNFIKKLNILKYQSIPEKKTCLKYTCSECVKSSTCLTGLSYHKLGKLAGWLQTVSYVHDKEYCSKNRCLECLLKQVCKLPNL